MLIVLKIAAVHITKLIFTCSGIFISDVRTSSDFYYIHCSLNLVFIRSREVAGTDTSHLDLVILALIIGLYQHLPDVAAALLLLVIVHHLATDDLHPRMELKENYLSFSSQIQSD